MVHIDLKSKPSDSFKDLTPRGVNDRWRLTNFTNQNVQF